MPGLSNLSRLATTFRESILFRIRCILIVLVMVLSLSPAFSQRTKIDSLKNVLLLLRDTTRIDCLNLLSLAYTYLNADTATSYQQKAFTEAMKMNYQRGEVMAFNNMARIAGNQQRNFSRQKEISLMVSQDYAELNDKKILGETYMNLALAYFCQSQFDKSAKACSKVLEISEKVADRKGSGESISMMGSISFERGDYEKSFQYFNQGLKIFQGINDPYNTSIVLAKIGDLYRLAGDYNTALNFYYQSLEFKQGPTLEWHPLVDLGDAYYSLEPYDSLNDQNTYLQTIKSLTIHSEAGASFRIRKAEKSIAAKNYDQALTLLTKELHLSKQNNDTNYTMRLLLDIGRVYDARKDFRNTFCYASELLRIAKAHHAKQYMRDGYRLMYMLHDQLNHVDSAYSYYRKYTAMKDSVALDDFSRKLAIHAAMADREKTKVQLDLVSKENQISEQQLALREQQLQREYILKNILIGGILLLVIFGVIIFRNSRLKQKNEAHQRALIEKELSVQKLENEKTKGELQQRALELEMQALRAQMNPHFIFNSLNSINRFILQSNQEKASEYLTKFSRLVRLILQNSQLSLISLESELESLRLYLELEAVRFDHHFEYHVTVSDTIDISAARVPPLVIQPYAENAIWHGLMHKADKGHLQIDLFEEGNLLCFKITDDGIGRKKASELKSKSASAHKSMGMRITADRIAILHNKQDGNTTNVIIRDILLSDGTPGGTEVCLKIPLL